MKKMLDLPKTEYDIEGISEAAKRLFKRRVTFMVAYFLALAVSVFLTVWLNVYLAVFIIGVMLSLMFGVLFIRQFRGFSPFDYSEIVGNIVRFHKVVKVVSTTSVGGVGFGTRRKYDSYKRDEMRLVISIGDGKRKCTYRPKRTSETHARYYEERGRAFHIWGTRYPVRLEANGETLLCPLCGEFNSRDVKHCLRCKNKILK